MTTEQRTDPIAAELRELRAQMASLQAEIRKLAAPPEVEEPPRREQPSYAWLTALEPPARRRVALPRLLVEAAFLVAAAAVAALADLDALVIAAVMAGAWVLVALAEWAASRADRERDALLYGPPPIPYAEEPAEDAAWFLPPVEQTLLENAESPDSETVVAKLPPAESEQTAERRPA